MDLRAEGVPSQLRQASGGVGVVDLSMSTSGATAPAVIQLQAAITAVGSAVAGFLAAQPSLPDDAVVAALGLAAALNRSSGGLQVALTREVVARSDAPPDQSLCRRHYFRSPREMIEYSFGTIPGATSGLLAVAESTAERRGLSSGLLPPTLGLLRKALDEGQVSVDQARVIAAGLPAAHRAAHPEMLQAAEEALVGGATGGTLGQAPSESSEQRLRPELLKAQATLWNRAIDPDGLAPDERRQRAARSFRLSQRRDGMWALSGLAPALDGAAIKTVLDAYTAPRVVGGTRESGPGSLGSPGSPGNPGNPGNKSSDGEHSVDAHAAEERVPDQIRFDVVAALFAQLASSTAAPRSGGAAPTLMVITRAAALQRVAEGAGGGGGGETSPADTSPADTSLDTRDPDETPGPDSALEHGAWLPQSGGVVSIGSLARIICDGEVQFLAADAHDEPLRLGRAARLFTPAQRRALMARDRRCRAPGCGFPASYCEAHHLLPWILGGATDIENGILLCNFHHHEAHAGRVVMTRRQEPLFAASHARQDRLEPPEPRQMQPRNLACTSRSPREAISARLTPSEGRADVTSSAPITIGSATLHASHGAGRPRLAAHLIGGTQAPLLRLRAQRSASPRHAGRWEVGPWTAASYPQRN